MIYASPISEREYEVEHHYSLTVETRPLAQPRGRAVRTKGGGVRVVSNTKRIKGFKQLIAHAVANDNTPAPPPRSQPMMLELECGMPVKNAKLHGRPHVAKPDSDNILKAVKDALVDAGVLLDDSQVVATETYKQYSAHPGYVVVRLSRLIDGCS